jgi:AcrR family transcriptional regulator
MADVSTASSSAPRGPGRPPRSPEARAAQRARLLDAAFAAVRRHGPDASVEEMAAEAGVSKPVFYSEFGDKYGIADAMAVALVEQGERQLMAELGEAGTIDLARALRLAVEGFFEVVTADPAVYGFIFRSIRSSDGGLLDNALMRSLEARFEVVAAVLAPGADPAALRFLAHGTFGFIISAIESWEATRAPSRELALDLIVTVLANGLLAAQALAPPPAG